MELTRRSYIRIVSFAVAALAVLIALAIISTNNMRSYKTQLEASYQQSLGELSGCLEAVNTDLTKTLYSNSSKELYTLSRDLYAQCQTAKNAVSRLPVSQMKLNNVYKFLSQASDYAQYISTELENGKTITEKQHKTLYTLLGYAEQFSKSASEMVSISQSGAKITDGAVKSGELVSTKLLDTSFSSGAKTFESFPTLLYDGPFSDLVLNKKSKLVTGSDVKTRDECRDIAANALDVKSKRVSYSGDDKSKLPCYTFKCGRYTVAVTKQGGYVKSIIYSGSVMTSSITEENAKNIAVKYLKELGYDNMKESYYSTKNNICTVNLAYTQDGMYCYPDLIKCSVALDSGRIVALDATTYLTNHIPRSNFSPRLSSADAQKKLSPYLTVNSVKRCVIPKENGKEMQCWEFDCTG
ncbi:MAG: germination protein YpeB, partial [Eubacterium sp.]|nr:germination protein YpeB [Eubacterium sp.]